MPIEAIIFDMDGVIVDSEDYWHASRIEYAESLGKTWKMDDQRAVMGRNTIEWAQIMQDRLALDFSLDDIMRDVKARIIAKLEARLPLLPGAVEAIKLAATAYPVALASGSPTAAIQTVMRLTELDKIFKVMVFGDDIERGKPHPDIYFEAAKRLNVAPERCVGIEDSGNGVRSLHAAGMITIAVPSPNFPLSSDILALADVHLPSLESFTLDLVRDLGKQRGA
ncbi:MAG: HAD family phosphatase [Chloroflexota bacterium]|nr:HAD family phosphatase [Chloroflexota bacterium]